MKNKKILLTILDGWGIEKDKNKDHINAISLANLNYYHNLFNLFPNCQLSASGSFVGLPENQIGNSEVGHMTIGAGRMLMQTLPSINNKIASNFFAQDKYIINAISNIDKNNNSFHIFGILSDGGVHGHIGHIIYFAKLISSFNIKVILHLFLDGRDVDQKSAIKYLNYLEDEIDGNSYINIGSIAGRYYAMDRDNNWDRIKDSYHNIIYGNDRVNMVTNNFKKYINESYKNNITDEFIKPISNKNYYGIKDNDSLLFTNFRSDRIRQLVDLIINSNFIKNFDNNYNIKIKELSLNNKIIMTKYNDNLVNYSDILIYNDDIINSLGEIVANNKLKQLRISETEKYAHVTFFFSCGKEDKFNNEDRILIQSKKTSSYADIPEMSSFEITDNIINNMKNYDLVIANYPNGDMVGHSGKIDSAVKACKIIEDNIKNLVDFILKNDYIMIITADHGNIENMKTEDNKEHTAHTLNNVPFIIIGNDFKNNNNLILRDGKLSDIAPTIVNLLKLKQPKEMTGSNLLSIK